VIEGKDWEPENGMKYSDRKRKERIIVKGKGERQMKT
jgi:hypothetical protein